MFLFQLILEGIGALFQVVNPNSLQNSKMNETEKRPVKVKRKKFFYLNRFWKNTIFIYYVSFSVLRKNCEPYQASFSALSG